jgi:hypothetical protein
LVDRSIGVFDGADDSSHVGWNLGFGFAEQGFVETCITVLIAVYQ